MGFSSNISKAGSSSYNPQNYTNQATTNEKASNTQKQPPQQNEIPSIPAPSYESLFPEARIPRQLFELGEKFGGPQMLSKVNESSAPSPVAKVYEDLFDTINSWDKLTAVIDVSASMSGNGSIVYFPGLGVDPQIPTRMKEGQILMGHMLDFILAARDPQRPLPIEFVGIHNSLGEENTNPQSLEIYGVRSQEDLQRFMNDHTPSSNTPMGKCIRAYCDKELANPQAGTIKRKFMILGDGEDNHDSSRKLASSIVKLWKNFNASVELFPLTPSDGAGLKWMDKSDTASPPGKVGTSDDFISEYIQILKTTVKNQHGRLNPKRDAALKEIKAIEKDLKSIEASTKSSFSFYSGRQNAAQLSRVPQVFKRLQNIEQKYELKTKDSRGLYSPFDYIAKALLSEIPKYDLADERDSSTHRALNSVSRGFNKLMV